MVRAGIAYSDAGHARIIELTKAHNIGIVELFESLAFADDELVARALQQGLPRRKDKMAATKAEKKAADNLIKTALAKVPADKLEAFLASQA